MLNRRSKKLGAPSKTLLREISGEDTGEPIDDADRRMAYGAYEDALAVIESAIAAEPRRPDLKFKALEILFVWGNGEKFLACANKFQRDLKASDDWSRVCIMGAEICPNERLFDVAA